MKKYAILWFLSLAFVAVSWSGIEAQCNSISEIGEEDIRNKKKFTATNKLNKSAAAVIRKLKYSNIFREGKRLAEEGKVRLDNQGFTKTHANLQIQTGESSMAAVLVDLELAKADTDLKRNSVLEVVQAALATSLTNTKVVTVNRNSPCP